MTTRGDGLSRRQFLGLSAAAAAGSACRSAGGADRAAMPPAIAALTSMADQARPISTEERRGRLDRASRLMVENGIDAVLLTGGTSMRYFTGIAWGRSERLFALVLPATGRPFLVTPAFEEGRAREQLTQSPVADDAEVRIWQEDEDPYRLVADGLRVRGLATGTLGVEETVRFAASNGIAGAAPAMALQSATPVTAGCRGRKDAHELELMRLASQVTLRAFDAVHRSIQVGMTGDDIGALIGTAHEQLGFSGGALVLVDESTALPHGTVEPQAVGEGSIVLIDGGCAVQGYCSDISRTFVIGTPTDKMRRVFEVELRAQTAALQAARPGGECQSVDAAARRVIDEAGFGPGYRCFTHRVGHGIGMDGHEWPYLVPGNTLPLQPGMTFSDEPGIYLPGEFGVRLEDDMVITEDGAELFTPQSPSLEDPFGSA